MKITISSAADLQDKAKWPLPPGVWNVEWLGAAGMPIAKDDPGKDTLTATESGVIMHRVYSGGVQDIQISWAEITGELKELVQSTTKKGGIYALQYTGGPADVIVPAYVPPAPAPQPPAQNLTPVYVVAGVVVAGAVFWFLSQARATKNNPGRRRGRR